MNFFYQSRVDTLNHNIYFHFPNYIEFIRIKDSNKLKQGSGFQDYEVRNDETKEALNFVFEDINEKKFFESQEKKRERIWDITLIIIGFLLGLMPTFLIYFLNRTRFKPNIRITFNNKPDKNLLEVSKPKGTAWSEPH